MTFSDYLDQHYRRSGYSGRQRPEDCPMPNPRGDDRLRRAQRYGDSDPKLEAWRRGLAVPPDELSERGGWARWLRPDGRVVIAGKRGGWARWLRPDGRVVIADFTPGVWSVLPPIGMQDVDWEIELEDEHVDPEDQLCEPSLGHEELVEEIRERLRGGDLWAWCTVRVVARWGGQEGDDYLGCCSYQGEREFKQGGYYEDMQRQAFDSLLDNLDVAQATADGEALAFGTEDELQGRERWWLDPVVQEAVFESYSMRMPGQNPGGSRGDARMRELERKAALGDQEALEALRAAQERSTDVPPPPEFEDFFSGYVECMLWAELRDAEGEPLNDHGRYTIDDVDGSAINDMWADCEDFFVANMADLQAVIPFYEASSRSEGRDGWELAGHDFCLTRNGHGAGFWDRGLGHLGKRLTEAAHVYGEQSLYLGDDGKVYVL